MPSGSRFLSSTVPVSSNQLAHSEGTPRRDGCRLCVPWLLCKNLVLYDARCWGFRGLEHAICSNQTGREAPLIMPRRRKAGKPKQYKLTDIRLRNPRGNRQFRQAAANLGWNGCLRRSGTGGSAATLQTKQPGIRGSRCPEAHSQIGLIGSTGCLLRTGQPGGGEMTSAG